MSKYLLRLWFEHGGYCVWSANNNAKKEYGYAVKNDDLPISKSLIIELNALEEEYATYLDWNCPQNPSRWTEEHKESFLVRATEVYKKLQSELGSDFEIANEVNQCI